MDNEKLTGLFCIVHGMSSMFSTCITHLFQSCNPNILKIMLMPQLTNKKIDDPGI